jgi:hypothetical protein
MRKGKTMDTLMSWNDGATGHAIVGLRHHEGSPDFSANSRGRLCSSRKRLANAASWAASMG